MKYAKEKGYDAFSTTLLVSIYQNHDAIKQIAEELAQKYWLRTENNDLQLQKAIDLLTN